MSQENRYAHFLQQKTKSNFLCVIFFVSFVAKFRDAPLIFSCTKIQNYTL